MRKLSELYELVYKEAIKDGFECGICTEIVCLPFVSDYERSSLEKHFEEGDHKFPVENRHGGYWFISPDARRDYLKYLIELCKSQDI